MYNVSRRMDMAVRQRRYSKEEFARRGDEIYEREIKPQVEPGRYGEIVVIDIDTGQWEIDPSGLTAGNRLRARVPDAQIWEVRVGSPYVYRFGGGQSAR